MADPAALRALVIDDDAAVRSLVADLLTMLVRVGTVDQASSGVAGLRLVDRHRYDLVVTDLLMPGMTGFEVADAVRRRSPETRVVLLTGSAMLAGIAQAGDRGYVLLHKPIRADDFQRTVEQLLAGPTAARG